MINTKNDNDTQLLIKYILVILDNDNLDHIYKFLTLIDSINHIMKYLKKMKIQNNMNMK
jgi:hypothetical protein